jgi:hypothetical protein
MKGSNGNTAKEKGNTNNRAFGCSVCATFLFSSLFFYYYFFFSFFCLNFFFAFALLIFFLSKEHTRTNHKKIELNW